MGYRTPGSKLVDVGLAEGFRSGLEEKVADQLRGLGVEVKFEQLKVSYVVPERGAKYTPDFELPNGIIIETKGRFLTKDRQKHILIKKQKPELDIRFVFSSSRTRISKTSTTTYADWCRKNGFQFADGLIPLDWIKE
jgi:hypothetical protein